VLAETGDGLEVVDLVETHEPDVLVLDLSLPGLNGLEVLRRVSERVPATEVVVLSMHSEDTYVVRAFAGGASAYVLKGAPTEELLDALAAVQAGEHYISSGLPACLLEAVERGETSGPTDRYAMLTEREREVLQLIAEGYTSQEIGDKLFISRRTVDKHRQNLMAKLECSHQADLVRFALQHSLIPIDPSEEG
jgi:DNA-binding NarL/FixJ family response regulator